MLRSGAAALLARAACAAPGAGAARGAAGAAGGAVAAGGKLDWDALGELIHSEEGKRELGALRAAYLDIQGRLGAMAAPRPPPAWDAFKRDLDPKLVDAFRAAFESMKLPRYEGADAAEAAARFAELKAEAKALSAASAARAAEIKAELTAIAGDKARLATATVDAELAADPKLAAEIDGEAAKQSFLVTP